jgi:hypothetical protein
LNRRPRAPRTPFAFEDNAEGIINQYLIDVPMNAGQILLMDQALIHHSSSNESNDIRIAVKPREDNRVYYHRVKKDNNYWLEHYSVANDFYLRQSLGERAYEGEFVDLVKEEFDLFPTRFTS